MTPNPDQSSWYEFPPLKAVYVDASVKDGVIAQNVKEALKRHPRYKETRWVEIEDYHQLIKQMQTEGVSFLEGKQHLLIYPEKGKFLHSCPGSDGVLCCRYYVIDFGMNCPYDCQYCYLQTYMNSNLMTLAGNIPELLEELKTTIETSGQTRWRIGTGEYTDSLALDHLTGLGSLLAKAFSGFENATLELKTKSAHIEGLLQTRKTHELPNTVLSWSLAPQELSIEVEKYCAPTSLRLEAAKKAVEAGFEVAFHFDPILLTENSEEAYLKLVDELMQTIDARKIRWISLGGFRYTTGLREKVRLRYPDEKITRSEMVRAPDSKVRYLAYARNRIYNAMREKIVSHAPDMLVYLCMETRNMWERVYGYAPRGPFMLDEQFENRRKMLAAAKASSPSL